MTYALSFPDALPPVLSTQWRKTKVVVDKDILAWSQPACILLKKVILLRQIHTINYILNLLPPNPLIIQKTFEFIFLIQKMIHSFFPGQLPNHLHSFVPFPEHQSILRIRLQRFAPTYSSCLDQNISRCLFPRNHFFIFTQLPGWGDRVVYFLTGWICVHPVAAQITVVVLDNLAGDPVQCLINGCGYSYHYLTTEIYLISQAFQSFPSVALEFISQNASPLSIIHFNLRGVNS